MDFEKVYEQLFTWCANENFAGYDPFDGLNSKIFQALPLKHLAVARLAWLQMVKRSEKNLRPLLKIEKGVNPKGIALFALAELARFRTNGKEVHAANSIKLLEKLDSLKLEIQPRNSSKPAKYAFGYNFDWQSRAFYAPLGTPTIVPTAFAAQAFCEAYEIFGETEYLQNAEAICRFIVEDLNRPAETEDEICFSYTPLDKSVIFNASLLAGECLGSFGRLTQNEEYKRLAAKTARFVVRHQRADGAWAYGSKLRHTWVDNFHTAYILLSLYRLADLVEDLREETAQAIEKGLNYWLENFFLDDGTPKYYDKQVFPIDIHSASAAIVALCELKDLDSRNFPLAEKVVAWTVANLRDEAGFFCYQKRARNVVKTPFIRWSQAWTAFALARFLEAKK